MLARMAATAPAPTALISYADLYARWERGNWQATAIDLTQDAIDWREKLTEEQRRAALWLYSLFFHGEDAVADDLSPYIDAAPTEEQTYFLTTQQVDEARHSVFFNRFVHEVAGHGDGTAGGGLRATASQLTWGHRMLFDRLGRMAEELRADPGPIQFARAVTLYHVVVEASLAQPGQHAIEEALERADVLPGFREGMRHVALDEQRHIGFGVKVLADLLAEHGRPVQDAIVEVLREAMPWTLAVADPPGRDETYFTAWGMDREDLAEAGALSLEQKLKAIGLDTERLPGLPMNMSIPARERGRQGQALLEHNFVGEGGAVVPDPEVLAWWFDGMARGADPRPVRPGTTIQWDLTDAEPWHLVLMEGHTTARQGTAPAPDLVLRIGLQDLVDMANDRADARVLLLRRRLRAKGDLRLLPKLAKVLG
jgi:hypothetical protein